MTIAEGPSTTAPPGSRPSPAELADALGPLAEELRLLVQQEIAFGRAELALTGRSAARAGAAFGVAGLLGALALASCTAAAALGLATVVPMWLAFLLVGVALAIAATAALVVARRYREAVSPLPRRTIANVKEDLAWLRAHLP